MKVTFVISAPSLHLEEFFRALALEGADFRVVYCEREHRFRPKSVTPGGYEHVFLRGAGINLGSRYLAVHPRLYGELRSDPAGLVIIGLTYYSPDVLIAKTACRRARKPFAYMNEYPTDWRDGRIARLLKPLLARAAVRGSRLLLAMGHAGRWQKLLGASTRVVTLPYYRDVDAFRSLERQPRDPGAPLRILFCGELDDDRKGLDVAIEACAACERDDYHLSVMGSGARRAEYEALAARLIPGRYEFSGAVPYAETQVVFARSDVFLLPTRYDGWGMVVPEALAVGLPVICTTACGAALEFVRDGINGRLTPPEDVLAVAQALQNYMTQPEVVAAHSRAAREAVTDFSPRKGAQRFMGLLEDIQ